jgi:SAM-dependent methyltransferase
LQAISRISILIDSTLSRKSLDSLIWGRIRMSNQSKIVSEDFKKKVKRNVVDNFNRSYRKYQAFEDKHRFFCALALKLADSINLQPKTSVLDVGCGSGISAKALNDRFACRVLGVDLSEKMVAAGRTLCSSEDVCLMVGDGERLTDLVADRVFDYVLYNASIFIFPDVACTIREAFGCLRPGGKIAFSFYPELVGPGDTDLLAKAFERLGEPAPRFKVVTGYDRACLALERYCDGISRHQWVRPLDLEFLNDFFSIPAQSASLFPGQDYETRQERTAALFSTLADVDGQGRIVWRMVEGVKAES